MELGGKLNPNEKKLKRRLGVRETQEEIGVIPLDIEKGAVLNFLFSSQSGLEPTSNYLSCKKLDRKPMESEE